MNPDLNKFGPAVARQLRPVSATPHPTMIPLDLAGLRRGLARRQRNFRMKIAILHYTSWPVIGGVETVIRQHALLLSRHGHEVSVFSGEGAAFSKQVPSIIFRELNTRDPRVKAAQQEAFSGHPGRAYFQLIERLKSLLAPLFAKFERLIVHNLFTMQFNMAATQALTTFADQGKKLIAWTHDLAANNSDYQIPVQQPFDLIRECHPNVKYVTISEARAMEFNKL